MLIRWVPRLTVPQGDPSQTCRRSCEDRPENWFEFLCASFLFPGPACALFISPGCRSFQGGLFQSSEGALQARLSRLQHKGRGRAWRPPDSHRRPWAGSLGLCQPSWNKTSGSTQCLISRVEEQLALQTQRIRRYILHITYSSGRLFT